MLASPSPSSILLDEDARHAFINNLAGNFCVSAGAGVGKTTAIVRRIANLALIRRREQPDLLSKLVVVTYGKLAAEELRVRTRDSILRHLDPGAIGRQTLLADLRSAFFGTIHSFCLKLIRDQGRFLGLPENVGLLEDRDNAALWDKFCESDGFQAIALPPTLLERVSRHLTFDQLLELARQLGPDETDPPADFDPEAPPPALNFSVALDDDGGRSKPKTREHQQHLQRWLEDFQNNAPFVKLPDYKGGSKTFLEAVAAAVQPYAQWLNDAASALAAIIARAYRDHRLEKGLMTYRDQIYWCRRLVAEPPVLRRLRQRGYVVILDEAQDTDAEMFGILTEITRAVDALMGTWPGDLASPGPEPGRFCFVGDDQQAIYSERADLRVYRAYVDAYKAGSGGQHLEFSVTMRCPQRVIDAANAVFGDHRLPQPFVEFRLLNARPDCPEGAAWRLELGEVPDSDGKATADAWLARECADIADFLKARDMAGLGITSWSEVAVICPRVAWLETAEQIFAERGLPGCLLSQKKIARELARHSWPAALLHVLVHPWDRFELIGVLREIFAVSDVDMARLHRYGDGQGKSGLQFWPTVPKERLRALTKLSSHRLQHALELLHELRAAMPIHPPMVGTTPLAGLAAADGSPSATLSRYVDFVFDRTALAARLETIGEPGEEAIRHLRVRAMQAECEGSTLRAWVRTLVTSLDEATPMQAGAASAIQFLTSLKAKGLEWPVVIPLGLGRQLRQRTENYPRIERFEGQARVHFSNVTVDATRVEARAQRQAEEFQRMLYVTLTRAKRLLIVPDSSRLHESREPNMLQLGRWDELDLEPLFTTVGPGSNEAPPPPSPDGTGTHQAQPKVFKEDTRRLKRAAAISCRIPQRILPSGLVHGQGGNEKPVELFPCGTDVANPGADSDGDRLLALENTAPPEGTRDEPLAGIGGVDYGNWWHAVMQHYPWKAARDVDRRQYLDHEQAKVASAAAWTARAAEELARLTASTAHADFLRRGEVFLSEMPFSYPQQPELWIEGIMDLVIVTKPDAGLWIVDWKTDRRWSSDASEQAFLDRLATKYAPQLQAYAEVFSKGFKRPVERLLLYSTVVGETIELT